MKIVTYWNYDTTISFVDEDWRQKHNAKMILSGSYFSSIYKHLKSARNKSTTS